MCSMLALEQEHPYNTHSCAKRHECYHNYIFVIFNLSSSYSQTSYTKTVYAEIHSKHRKQRSLSFHQPLNQDNKPGKHDGLERLIYIYQYKGVQYFGHVPVTK